MKRVLPCNVVQNGNILVTSVKRTNLTSGLVFLVAALLEVGGDTLIRRGIKGGGWLLVVLGFVALGCYGLVVNYERSVDFSKLMGAYVAAFALVSILAGRFVFGEKVPPTTWLGLFLIVAGGFVIQFGSRS